MPLDRPTLCMAVIAACCGGLLGVQWQLRVISSAGLESQALVRYTGIAAWAGHVLVATALAWGITRFGNASGKSRLGPNAQLNLFHDGNALVGTALIIALHGTGATSLLLFAAAGRLLVSTFQAARLRTGIAVAAVWTYAAASVLVNSTMEGAGLAYWCTLAPAPLAARMLPLALALDRFSGAAPVHFTIGVAFRYSVMRFVSWALDTLSGRVAHATAPTTVNRAFPASTATPAIPTSASGQRASDGSGAVPESPRIGAVGGVGANPNAAAAAEYLAMLSTPDSPQKLYAASTAGLASATWSAYFSYLFFAPLYLTGPVVTAADFYQQAAAVTAGRPTTQHTLDGGSLLRAAARMAGFAGFAEVARRTVLNDGVMQPLLAAHPGHTWAVAYCVFTALFAQNFVPWTFARLLSAGMGITTPDEAPVGFLTSSVSPATFWRNYHVSWYRWLRQYVYFPLGATPAALVLTLVTSTLLHGTHRWLLPDVPPPVRAALVQAATQTTLLVQLPLGPSLWTTLLWFHAINLPFLVCNAARLARQEGRTKPATASKSADPMAASLAKLAAAVKVAQD